MIITIYDAEQVGPPPAGNKGCQWLIDKQYRLKITGGLVWSEKNGGAGDEPTHLTINTFCEQRVFTVPRLIYFCGSQQVLSALSDHDASGTSRSIKKYYILIEDVRAELT